MKKYVALFLLSASIILIVFAVGYTRVENTEFVKAVRVERETAVEKLNYSGTIEYSGSSTVNADGSGVVQSVFFKNGDRVEKGEPILSVCETYADLSGNDLLSSVLTGSESLSDLVGSGGAVNVYSAERSGRISGLDLDSGGLYMKGQTLFKISDESSFQVQLNIPEKDISKIKKGQKATIDCKAAANVFQGEVAEISDSAKQTSTQSGKLTTVRVIVKLTSGADSLKPGYTADCTIITAMRENTLLAPYSSIAYDSDGGAYVYISEGHSVERRSVKTGTEYSNGIEITEGISEGDIIVYDADKVENEKRTVAR